MVSGSEGFLDETVKEGVGWVRSQDFGEHWVEGHVFEGGGEVGGTEGEVGVSEAGRQLEESFNLVVFVVGDDIFGLVLVSKVAGDGECLVGVVLERVGNLDELKTIFSYRTTIIPF